MYIAKSVRRMAVCAASLLIYFHALGPAIAADAPPQGKALVYVIQGETGSFYSLVMRVDGVGIGRVKSNSYITFVADPGTHQVSTAAFGIGSISIKVDAGKVFYLAARVNAQGTPEFRLISEAEAQPLLVKAGAKRNDAAPPASTASRAGAPSALPVQKTAPVKTAPPAAKPGKKAVTQSQPRKPQSDGVVVFIKSGSFKLSEGTQQWFNTDSLIDTKASGYFGAGLDYQFANGFAVGVEYFKYKNSWVQTNGSTGSFTSSILLATGKKYFAINEIFYPYLGIGIGTVETSFSGDITGGTTDTASQLMAGIEFRFRQAGVFVELSSLFAKTTAANGDKIDASGTGTSVGLRFHF